MRFGNNSFLNPVFFPLYISFSFHTNSNNRVKKIIDTTNRMLIYKHKDHLI